MAKFARLAIREYEDQDVFEAYIGPFRSCQGADAFVESARNEFEKVGVNGSAMWIRFIKRLPEGEESLPPDRFKGFEVKRRE